MRKQKPGAPANRNIQYWHGPNYLLQHLLEVNGHLRNEGSGYAINGIPIAKQSLWQKIKGLFA